MTPVTNIYTTTTASETKETAPEARGGGAVVDAAGVASNGGRLKKWLVWVNVSMKMVIALTLEQDHELLRATAAREFRGVLRDRRLLGPDRGEGVCGEPRLNVSRLVRLSRDRWLGAPGCMAGCALVA